MNQILLFEKDFICQGRALIRDRRRINHITDIIGLESGKQVKAGRLNGLCGTALIHSASESGLEFTDIKLNEQPPKALPLILVVALPRPKSFKKLLHYAAAMGVKQFHFIRSWRVEKSYWNSPVFSEESIFHELVLALEQCRDTMLPQVSFHKGFKPFVEDLLPELGRERLKLLAHPYNAGPCPGGLEEESILVLGPEGGFIEYEVEAFVNQGFQPVTTGRRILRIENAVPALLGRLYL